MSLRWVGGRYTTPLIVFLKNNDFTWNIEVVQSLKSLKEAMCMTPVLELPKFTKVFVLKCDASKKGIWVFLMQDGKPLAFTRNHI
jgi:hypothetical protein